jgi:hypothetical protein
MINNDNYLFFLSRIQNQGCPRQTKLCCLLKIDGFKFGLALVSDLFCLLNTKLIFISKYYVNKIWTNVSNFLKNLKANWRVFNLKRNCYWTIFLQIRVEHYIEHLLKSKLKMKSIAYEERLRPPFCSFVKFSKESKSSVNLNEEFRSDVI